MFWREKIKDSNSRAAVLESKAPNPLMIRAMSPCSSLSLVIPHTINSKIHAIKIVEILMTAGKMAIYLPATAEVVAINAHIKETNMTVLKIM